MAGFDWRRLIGKYGPDTSGGSTGLGPDFPESAGDRERGKFRPSDIPRLTTIAVTNDDGSGIGSLECALLREVLLELRMLRLGMVMTGAAEEVLPEEAQIDD